MEKQLKQDQQTWESLSAPQVLMKTCVGSVLSERFRCLRTNAEGDFISFQFPDWVVVLAETPDHKLLIVRQYRHGAHAFYWEIPGGCIDAADPDPLAAGLRELKEETGYEGEDAVILGSVCPNPALQSNRCYTVYVRNVRKTCEPQLEATESLECSTMTLDEILALIRDGSFDHGIMMDSILYYMLEKEKNRNEKCV